MQEKLAVIYGMEGVTLNAEEKAFFSDVQPMGYILFQRNCESPEQVKALTDSLREIAGTEQVPILIDQEGGRVARLKPPHWRAAPSAAALAVCADEDIEKAKRLIYLNARLIASELAEVGVNTDCAPLADVPTEACHNIIGDRAYGDTAERVAELGREMSRGLLDGSILPVLKHIPGHGRALVDSHEDLPVVDATMEELRAQDFVPFERLRDIPLGMTAHIRYNAIDSEQCATLSKAAISLIRDEIGYDGLLMSDDVSMKALKGDFETLSRDILAAGCDVVLHCNGEMDEMRAVAKGARAMDAEAIRRINAAWQQLNPSDESVRDLLAEFDSLYENKSAVA